MRYRFFVDACTNEPIKAEIELEKALDIHAPLIGSDLHATGHELAVFIKPEDIGNAPDGDPWRFHVEGEANSPDWVRGEIQKAINNYAPAAAFGLTVQGVMPMASQEEREDTAADADRWLRQQSGGRE